MHTFHLSWRQGRRRAEVTLRPGRISVGVDRLRMVDADAEGRLLRAVFGPSTWRRSYADRYIEVVSEAVNGERFHVPRVADAAEGRDLVARVRALVDEVADAARTQAPDASDALARVLSWDVARLEADGERFRRIYPVIGPLPPDQQTALVLRCCDGFEAHVNAVLAFLGRAREMRQGVYLDGVDDIATLTAALEVTRRVARPGEPVSAALGGGADAAEAAGKGLSRVYAPLDEHAATALDRLHATQIHVSLVTPAPSTLEEAEALAARVDPLDLRSGDTLYTLEPRPYPATPEHRVALRRAWHHFRARLRFADPPAGPVITHYPIVQSVY